MFTQQFKRLVATIFALAGLFILVFAGLQVRENALNTQDKLTLLNNRVSKLELAKVSPTASPSATPTVSKKPGLFFKAPVTVAPTK